MRDTAAKVAGKPDEDELRLTRKHNELRFSSYTPAKQTCQASAWLLGFGISISGHESCSGLNAEQNTYYDVLCISTDTDIDES